MATAVLNSPSPNKDFTGCGERSPAKSAKKFLDLDLNTETTKEESSTEPSGKYKRMRLISLSGY